MLFASRWQWWYSILSAIWCLNGRSKVNHFHHSLVWNKPKCEISPKYEKWRLPPCRAQGEDVKMCTLYKFVVPDLKCTPYNFNGCWFSCSYRSVGVTHTCSGWLRRPKFIMHNTEVHKDIGIVYGNWMAAECRFVLIILTVSLFCMFIEQKTEVKLKWFWATMTDRLWQFIRNTSQPWNNDKMAFFVYRNGWSCQNQVAFVLLMLCCKSLNNWK